MPTGCSAARPTRRRGTTDARRLAPLAVVRRAMVRQRRRAGRRGAGDPVGFVVRGGERELLSESSPLAELVIRAKSSAIAAVAQFGGSRSKRTHAQNGATFTVDGNTSERFQGYLKKP